MIFSAIRIVKANKNSDGQDERNDEERQGSDGTEAEEGRKKKYLRVFAFEELVIELSPNARGKSLVYRQQIVVTLISNDVVMNPMRRVDTVKRHDSKLSMSSVLVFTMPFSSFVTFVTALISVGIISDARKARESLLSF